jgi:hypothetical protein
MEYVSYLFIFKRAYCRRLQLLTLYTQSVSGGISGMILTMEKVNYQSQRHFVHNKSHME